MGVSIIIPACNAERTMAECLEACLSQTHPDCEVIVVDDGSTDGTGAIASRFAAERDSLAEVRYFRQQNKGPAAARNLGAAHARGDVFAFTDSDCIPRRDWIERLLEGFEEGVAGVGGTYANAEPGSPLARMLHEEIRARHDRCGRYVDFLGSFNVAYKREAFEAAGGFDETFSRASAEDNDLAYRLHDAGGRLRFRPEAVVAHHHPTRLWPYLRTQARHGYWRMKLYRKHPRRARTGDRYADALDLTAPPLALMFVAALPAQAVVGPPATALAVVMLAAYALVRAPLAQRMVNRSGDARMYAFAGVALLRDIARAAGMVAGVLRFWGWK